MSATETPTRGGKRPGAGRPITGETATEPRTVTLLPHHWAMLEQQNDNVSAALRDALDRLAALEPKDEPYRIEFDNNVLPGRLPPWPNVEFKPGGTIVDATDVQSIQLTLLTDRGEVVDTTAHFAVLENVRQIRFFVERPRHRRVYPNGID